MLFNYKYGGNTTVTSSALATGLSFAPDTLRDPVFFVGKLQHKIAFREAISALHDVVVSDLRFKPKDKTAYKEWAAQQEAVWLSEYLAGYNETTAEASIKLLKQEIAEVRSEKDKLLQPFYKAKRKYFDYLYHKDKDAWIVLDPVITVHPDEMFFECFSQDESTYGRLGANYNVFKEVNDFKCGTTNIDYSADLYNEFQKIRDYKETDFKVDPSGFEVQTTREDLFKEVKIDLPESWVRGFLQVSSAMTLPATRFDLHPMDVHNFCSWLRRFREKKGPRYIRYVLNPGEPVKVVFEPWGKEIICSRSVYTGSHKQEIKIWGRRRLLILERLIPLAKKFTVHLLGTGMPSFYIADLGDMNFTLGLSGWTANDWSRAGNFDLMAPRAIIDDAIKAKVFAGLSKEWYAETEQLAQNLGLSTAEVAGALGIYTQAGRVMFDLEKNVYRLRELSREPLPMDKLRFSNPNEELASELLTQLKPVVKAETISGVGLKLSATIKIGKRTYNPELVIDEDERIKTGNCDCSFYIENKLYKGPCEHMLAMRLQYGNTKRTEKT
ncbi:SWIM zinc finger family protein [Terrimonas rubra]|uniref:SWIM zinc finger family protein n=1 Tax=Terrimonas rubra TaxID=1035890 RepID=A0ABW6AB41_9BACT